MIKECDKVYRYLYQNLKPPLGYFTSFPHGTHKDMSIRHKDVLKDIHPKTWYLNYKLDPWDQMEVVVRLKGESKYMRGSAGEIVYSLDERNNRWLNK